MAIEVYNHQDAELVSDELLEALTKSAI